MVTNQAVRFLAVRGDVSVIMPHIILEPLGQMLSYSRFSRNIRHSFAGLDNIVPPVSTTSQVKGIRL